MTTLEEYTIKCLNCLFETNASTDYLTKTEIERMYNIKIIGD